MRPRPSFQLSSILMYLLTAVIEAPVILLRILLVALAQLPLLLLRVSPPSSILFLVALAPTLWSLVAFATPAGSGWWWRQHSGGRDPSQRERLAYQDAVEHLQAHSESQLALPSSWFVVDELEPNAAVCGDSLLIARGLLESEYLPAVLAHELGHLASLDGRLTAALNRLVIHQAPRPHHGPVDANDPGAQKPAVGGVLENMHVTQKTQNIITFAFLFTLVVRALVSIARGGIALRVLRLLWGRCWREREYAADAYAASLGQAQELAEFLEIHALIHDHPVPFLWLSDTEHPATELRIDRLHATTHQPIPDTTLPATA